MTTVDQFISRVLENYNIEFIKPKDFSGWDFIISKITVDGRLYRIKMSLTKESIHDMSRFCDPWDEMYQQIVHMISSEMLNPYPKDPQQSQRRLIKYVTDFITEHKINSGEQIHQSDKLLLLAPEFMDECCELIGYYEED